MSSPLEVVERGDRAFNDHDVEALRALYAEDAEFSAPGGMTAKGPDEIVAFLQSWYQGFPDCRTTVNKRWVDGNTVIEDGVFIGTHTGVFPTPMGDIPPTGKRVEGAYIDIFEIRDGKCVSDRLTFDRMQLMEQLGLVPQPAGAAG